MPAAPRTSSRPATTAAWLATLVATVLSAYALDAIAAAAGVVLAGSSLLQGLDASVLLLPDIGLIEPSDARFVSTVAAIEKELRRGQHMMRYANSDDFGMPEAAFLTCRFWLIDAWWWLGRREEAHELFVDALGHRNRYGLLAEDIHPQTGEMWGNFPQAYSHVGLIHAAFSASPRWSEL